MKLLNQPRPRTATFRFVLLLLSAPILLPAQPQTFIGVGGGGGISWYDLGERFDNALIACIDPVADGPTARLHLTSQFRFNQAWSLSIRGGANVHRLSSEGDLYDTTGRFPIEVVNFDSNDPPISDTMRTLTRHSNALRYSTAALDLTCEWRPIGGRNWSAGLTGGFSVQHVMEGTELLTMDLVDPWNARFIVLPDWRYEHNGRRQVLSSGRMPDLRPFRFSLLAGLFVELGDIERDNLLVSPGLMLEIPTSPMTGGFEPSLLYSATARIDVLVPL